MIYNLYFNIIIKLEKYYEIIMILCIHYVFTIHNDSEIPLILHMKERLQQKSNSQNQQLPHLFTKK